MSDLIKQWYDHELSLGHASADGKYLLMGCPIWGDTHRDTFIGYCLPSLMASPNRLALEERGWQLVLYLDEVAAAILRPLLESWGLSFELRTLPSQLLDLVAQDDQKKFPLLAAVHNLLVHEAGRCGAGYHMLLPDHVFALNFVPNLFKLTVKYNAVCQTSLTSLASDLGPKLKPYYRKHSTVLAVPPDQLGTFGWESMTPQWQSWSLDGLEQFDILPLTDFIFWRTRHTIRMHCAHQNAMWISSPRCRRAQIGYGGTIDSELPKYMCGQAYVPQAADNLSFIALSGGGPEAPKVPIGEFKQAFEANLGKDIPQQFLEYFKAPCEIPVLSADGFPSEVEVGSRFQRLMSALDGA